MRGITKRVRVREREREERGEERGKGGYVDGTAVQGTGYRVH